jgi:hypothetical protein
MVEAQLVRVHWRSRNQTSNNFPRVNVGIFTSSKVGAPQDDMEVFVTDQRNSPRKLLNVGLTVGLSHICVDAFYELHARVGLSHMSQGVEEEVLAPGCFESFDPC